MTVCVRHWDAFTSVPGKGNPAGIVLDGQDLSASQMQEIARSIGFNDTAFVLSSTVADLRIRYFAPRREVDVCGHATIAAFSAIHREGLLRGRCGPYTLETKSGLLPIDIIDSSNAPLRVVMTQAPSQFASFNGDRHALARALGIAVTDFHASLPIVYGSTGRWTLVVPIKDLQAIERMHPNPNEFAAVLNEMPNASIHPFCLQTLNRRADMHARHFSSPASGTLEDAVTGTASGVLGAYYRLYIADDSASDQALLIEQGCEIGREGTVQVWASQQHDHYAVRIAGSACFVREIAVALSR